jgi:hypothetical protein
MEKRFKVISIHYTTECPMNCPFCYKKRTAKEDEKPLEFWYELVPYLSGLTTQIALGGGEPFTNMEFIKKFGKVCKENGLLFNITSNGKLLKNLSNKELKSLLKDVTMISLSYDSFKVKDAKEKAEYFDLVRRIKNACRNVTGKVQRKGVQVGCNLLIENNFFRRTGGKTSAKFLPKFITLVDELFEKGIDRVFALYPKNISNPPDILKFKKVYVYLTRKYPHFYIDDLTKMILEKGKWKDWDTPCHYFKDLISINEKGEIFGCSFDDGKKPLLKLKKPKDILKINKIQGKERFSCPYLMKGGN